MTTPPLHGREREYAAWMGDVERRVMLPLKWVLLLLCLGYWMWMRNGMPPPPEVFAIFLCFGLLTLAEHYFFARDRITPRQVQPFVYTSFVVDVGLIAALVVLDSVSRGGAISEFTFLFVVLVLRGFALFRTQWENVVGFSLVSAAFLGSGWYQLQSLPVLAVLPGMGRLAFTWGLMLIAQAFVGMVNRQKQEELASRERLVRSASLASLGDLAAGVAHEINNPIGIIKTYVDYLEKSTPADDPLRDDFATIRDEAQRCQEIVRRMLDFANPQLEGMAPLDLEALAREVSGFVFHDGHAEGVAVELVVAERLPAVMGDSVQLRQALVNVLSNARQVLGEYRPQAPAGWAPRVVLTLDRVHGPRAPLRLQIHDNGPGITPADAARVFEPFFTRRSKGTGLGMAITRRIIEAHDGAISIAPHPDGGTIVTMTLPMAGEESA